MISNYFLFFKRTSFHIYSFYLYLHHFHYCIDCNLLKMLNEYILLFSCSTNLNLKIKMHINEFIVKLCNNFTNYKFSLLKRFSLIIEFIKRVHDVIFKSVYLKFNEELKLKSTFLSLIFILVLSFGN